MPLYFSGRVHSVIYDDPAQAFYILKMSLDAPETPEGQIGIVKGVQATVKGHVPGIPIKVGTWFGFEGNWKTHKTHGKQLAITKAPILKNGWDADTAEKMLSANGVGPRLLLLARQYLGEDFVAALSDPKQLEVVPGIDEFTALHISQRWTSTQAYFKTLTFLNDLGVPNSKVREVWAKFGGEAEEVLAKNPWALVRLEGFEFSAADEIAIRLGLPMDGENRVYGAVLYCARTQRGMGHLYMRTGQVMGTVQALIPGVTTRQVASALKECHLNKDLVVDRETLPGAVAVYEPWSWEMESESAKLLHSRRKTAAYGKGGLELKTYFKRLRGVGPDTKAKAEMKRPRLATVIKTAIEEWGLSSKMVLSDTQKKGIFNALTEPVSVLTGLPGTGKTTSLRAAVRILQDSDVPFLLCAPTGIAAKNLSALSGAPAHTIHRAFSARGKSDDKRESTYTGIVGEADGEKGDMGQGSQWGFSVERPHPAEVVFVDESSMVDQHLMYRLLTCTSPQCRLVFVGDPAQLPSVGPGNVLRDLVSSDVYPVVHLVEIFRQEETSDIVFAAHDIYKGEVPSYTQGSEFSLLILKSEEMVLEAILKMASKLYDQRRNFQVLSPRHGGTVGVTNLNDRIRMILNPQGIGLQEVRLGGDVIREGDRIMVVKNDYEKGVFNGDVGKVSRINRKDKEVELKIFGQPPVFVKVAFKDLPRLIRLAYACTVHKAQGLEYDVIVMPLIDGFRHQLQRNLLYTAVTRAKKRVVLVGTHTALASAVFNDKEDLRNTLFKQRLQALAS